MLSRLVCLIALLPLWWQVLGGEIPVVDGVLGGVPHFNASASTTTGAFGTDTGATIVPTSTSYLTTNDRVTPTTSAFLGPPRSFTIILRPPTRIPPRPSLPRPSRPFIFPTFPPFGIPRPPPRLRVLDNPGVCETTPGVYQATGYGDLSPSEHIWFWFFAARKNPDTAPLVLWFNGGPGASSMIGLFQEHGPCRINDDRTVVLNPKSWNSEANVLYIDQPVGTGFSYGDLRVDKSEKAAQDVWRFLQLFLSDSRFSKYRTNPLAIWTESYGGHYGPIFADYFLRRNWRISTGFLRGIRLNLKVLGIGNGLTDPLAQYPEYISYATENPYHSLVPPATISTAKFDLTDCMQQISACYAGGTNAVCSGAQGSCNKKIYQPLYGNWSPFDVRRTSLPLDIKSYLDGIRASIGADVPWVGLYPTNAVYTNFAATGDWMTNARPILERVIDAGIRTLVYAGDADYACNYKGVEAMVEKLQTKFTDEYGRAEWTPYMVRGVETGKYKQVGTFAYLRVFGAGHFVPADTVVGLDRGEAALQFFNQITFGRGLS